MWDSHFRVGGAAGSNLGLADCPIGGDAVNRKCMGASMLMHITGDASGYFENVWAWVADHDLDSPLNALATESPDGVPLNVQTDISVYVGRGILIESQGPTWLYGTASEHAQMYQYQLSNAANIYMGHMQTETPYYQPKPNALSPYTANSYFPSDPTYKDCSDDLCRGAWALRVLNSTDVFIYSAGFYSWFQAYDESCVSVEHCQQSLIQTNYAKGLWMYNIFTKGNVEVVSPEGGLPALLFNDTTRNGFTSEIAAWLSLSTGGGDIGSDGDDSGAVYIDPVIWSEPDDGRNISCYPPCTYVLPPTTLPTARTFVYPTLVTVIGVGYEVPTYYEDNGSTTTTTTYITSTTTTTLTIPDVVTPVVGFWDVTIEPSVTASVIIPTPSIIQSAFNITWPPLVRNSITYPGTVVPFYPPPWTPDPPSSTPTPTATSTSTSSTTIGGGSTSTSTSTSTTTIGGGGSKTTGSHDHDYPAVTHHSGPPKPKCTDRRICGVGCHEGLGGLLNRIFHVCNPCWTGCGGIDSPNNFPNDPNDTPDNEDDPNGDPSESRSECSTATYSSCSTACVTASSTSSCSSTCRDIVGCDTTGTSMVGTYTLPPILAGTAETWTDH
ncbi:hypothetical protein CNMCM7691_007065 [Aspergillus felis]|uniref:Rhodanese domain-containing protein n=1 Tax=Aspergillus felis TaxID=1287682 RepID=A0A8H6VE57_9EURO|nr:hypothetical protein CNMCM7691_007065 [Aspergillus felis]